MVRKFNFILLSLALLFAVQAKAQTSNLKVWMDDVSVTADGSAVTRLYVYENDVVNYAAFNLNLIVPEGISIAQVKSGRNMVNDIRLTERLADHTISCNMIEDGRTIKVIATSPSNSDFYPDDVDGNVMDSIFSIGLIADPSMFNGEYEITIEACKFVLADGNANSPGTVTATMTVTGGQEGQSIDFVMSEAGMGTLILPFDAAVPAGLNVFKCTEVVGTSVIGVEQQSIKANTPLLVTGAAGKYTFKGISVASENLYSEGVLSGVMTETSVSQGYVLQSQNGVVGFYKINYETPVTVPAYKCYLEYVAPPAALSINLYPVTGIGSVVVDNNAETIYDLQGRKVSKVNAKRGVYIINGEKKVLK